MDSVGKEEEEGRGEAGGGKEEEWEEKDRT